MKTIFDFYKRKNCNDSETTQNNSIIQDDSITEKSSPQKFARVEVEQVTPVVRDFVIRDPGLRLPIWEIPNNQRGEIRRAYIQAGPYQHILIEYPASGKHNRRFQSSWFNKFPTWLEYSPSKDAAFCLPCYLFSSNSSNRFGSDVFTIKGFRNWNRVNGKNCAFLMYVGTNPSSPHKVAEIACKDLMMQVAHVDKVIEKQTSHEVLYNRLRLKTSIFTARWLTFQACAFRGHDESSDSENRGNFIEMIQAFAEFNDEIAAVVLDKAPKNAKFTSPTIQKEILQILASKVRNAIREEIGDAYFCIIVDEARDESKREQMALVIRFVDKEGFVRERFLDIVHVQDTTSQTLKLGISSCLSRHNLSIQQIRGQGYDGASNMRGEWNGLQALILNECPYAYFVHCLAHRLQLALVAASKEVIPIYHFFTKLTSVINIIGASCKRNDELHAAQVAEIAQKIAINELEAGRGANQIGTLHRAGDTRWGSHFSSVCSLLKLFGPTNLVLRNIIKEGTTFSQRADADAAYNAINTFEFIFILHLMKEIMGITYILCQSLQLQNQDILNAMNLVSTTKALIQNMRIGGWGVFISNVESFCQQHGIEVPDMNAIYAVRGTRSRHNHDPITHEHHFRVDIFTVAIDSQMQELNQRFNDQAVEFLRLSTALDPSDGYKSFNIENICLLVEKFYPRDFTEQERLLLEYQLQYYKLDVTQDPALKNLMRVSDVCKGLSETGKSKNFYLIDRLIRLILTLLVSTATTERAFSVMKLVKTRLRNKMEDHFLADSLVIYIEKGIAKKFDLEELINDFYSMKNRRAQLQ